ncbi:MAG: hypothetical protein F9K44_00705 [Hyphomicrobiaceae bacterium]|nr:MAG: hypothetical protein F9K44_00705 [Hyphomicrobiaceae bacterium]
MPAWILYYVAATFGAMMLALLIGRIKNRDAQQWAFFCFLFPPAILLLLVLPRRQSPRPKRMSWEEDHRRTLARDDTD